jgi:hypothetical protein
MYACKMQIFCYNNVKYSTGIKFHFYHISWIFCFCVRHVWGEEISGGIQRVLIQIFKLRKHYLFRVWWSWDTSKKQECHK